FGPWPLLNTFKPMNNVIVEVYPDKPDGQRLQLSGSGLFSLRPVYAQAAESGRRNSPYRRDRVPCALSVTRLKVSQLPGFFRSSGRVYFRMLLAGKDVEPRNLLYGPGIGFNSGQFPLDSDKELWLPVKTGSDDRYSGLLADLTHVATCRFDAS